jgi:CubicO group peptidase (beta-lactamase class C family)
MKGSQMSQMSLENLLEISPEITLKLEEIVRDRVASVGTPGIFATLFQGDRIFLEKGFGVRALTGTVPDANTTFRIASCTKSFTIAALLKLRDEGKLQLDQQITEFVPEFIFSTLSSAQTIPTLRRLASMSSGLPTDDPWADRQESISSQDLREIVSSGVNATHNTGEVFNYSNLGFALIGLTIESASGRDFREFVTTEFLKPLGMNETGFDAHDFPESSLAKGYRKVEQDWIEQPFSASGAFSSIGGLFSSGKDLRIWSNWFYSAFTYLAENEGLLSAATRREMQRIATPLSINAQPNSQGRIGGYGLGLFVEDDRRFGQFVSHSGGYPGFSSHMRWHLPTGLSVVVLENATYSGAMATAISLLDVALEGINFEVPKPKPWPVTYEYAAKAESWLRNIRNKNVLPPVEIFAENVDLDIPFPERVENIERLIQEVGGLKETTVILAESSDSPLHLLWNIAGNKGELACEIRLTPASPTQIQTFKVSIKSD